MYACHVIFMRERFVIERLAVEPNLLIWFKKYRSPLSTLSPSPAGQWWIWELWQNMTISMMILWRSKLYDDEKILMMMLLRWWWFFSSFPTDWSMQKKISIFQSTICALWNWPKSNLEIARGGGGTEMPRLLRQIQKKTEIQTQRQIQRQIHTHRYGKIPNTQSRKDPNAKSRLE